MQIMLMIDLMEEGTKNSYEKPDQRKTWTGGSKWVSKMRKTVVVDSLALFLSFRYLARLHKLLLPTKLF